MKSIFLLLAALAVAACGERSNPPASEKGQVATTQTVAEKAVPVNRITKDGIGPLRLGMPMGDIPASVDGLYDSFKAVLDDEWGDECLASYALHFIKDGEVVFEGTADDGENCNGKYVIADLIVIENPLVEISIGGTLYKCGDQVADLISSKAITQKGKGSFDKDTYLYEGVEIGLTSHLHAKSDTKNPVVRTFRIFDTTLMTPFPEDFVP